MRRSRFKCLLVVTLVAVLTGSPVLSKQAEGRGGFSGAGFRGGAGYVEGPRGDAAAVGPAGGVAVRGSGGNVVASLPDGARRVAVAGRNYYVVDDVYYQPCYVGDVVNYCVVDAPDTDDDND